MPRGCRRHTSWPVLERAWRLRHHQLDPNEREPRQILLPLLNTPDGVVGNRTNRPGLCWTAMAAGWHGATSHRRSLPRDASRALPGAVPLSRELARRHPPAGGASPPNAPGATGDPVDVRYEDPSGSPASNFCSRYSSMSSNTCSGMLSSRYGLQASGSSGFGQIAKSCCPCHSRIRRREGGL